MTPPSRTPAPPAPSRADEASRLVDALAQLSFLVHNALADIAGQHDLSIIQVRLLGILRDRKPTMNALGRHLGLDKSSVSGLVDRAQRRGMVDRTVSTTDRRAFQVSITETGRRLVEQVSVGFSARVETLVAGLPDTDRKLLTQLAAQIVTTDAHRRGIDLRTADLPDASTRGARPVISPRKD